jgi:hypothetical protein
MLRRSLLSGGLVIQMTKFDIRKRTVEQDKYL